MHGSRQRQYCMQRQYASPPLPASGLEAILCGRCGVAFRAPGEPSCFGLVRAIDLNTTRERGTGWRNSSTRFNQIKALILYMYCNRHHHPWWMMRYTSRFSLITTVSKHVRHCCTSLLLDSLILCLVILDRDSSAHVLCSFHVHSCTNEQMSRSTLCCGADG